MFDTRTRLFFFACLEDAAGVGAALKSAAPAPSSGQQKISSSQQKIGSGSGAALKVAAPEHWNKDEFSFTAKSH